MSETVALKEWAAVVRALREGRQIVVLRKGGIAEETREFRLESHSFALYPTYEHQKPEWLKPEFRPLVEATAALVRTDRTEWIDAWAEVINDLEIWEKEGVERLRGFHIWTDDLVDNRLKWKPGKPLHALVLRVYRLDPPIEVPFREEYAGCRSWIRLNVPIPFDRSTPALPDAEFEAKARLLADLCRNGADSI
ncbi:MAG: hypothetical protein BLM47_12215 [Candidatus Reconcilbacillus cellulovorans]|uniref:DUF1802 domain-containing protein n=1 Tax=Candidatus Reconcilbacillus cellulovorans TaxID=1906605 RepID=A0A2A6DXN8_9BACL|nr:MAG: hypothetical protein BLM47_12215 [Candidatus Reconcilbacillus cellulovorans]